MLSDKIFYYLSRTFDEHGIIPSEDEVYEKFQLQFDNGVPFDIAEEELRKFKRNHKIKKERVKSEVI